MFFKLALKAFLEGKGIGGRSGDSNASTYAAWSIRQAGRTRASRCDFIRSTTSITASAAAAGDASVVPTNATRAENVLQLIHLLLLQLESKTGSETLP